MSIRSFDFLQQPIACHWGGNIYLRLFATGSNSAQATLDSSAPGAPSTPSVSVVPLGKSKAIGSVENIPSSSNNSTTFYFIWTPTQTMLDFGPGGTCPPVPFIGGFSSFLQAITDCQIGGPGQNNTGTLAGSPAGVVLGVDQFPFFSFSASGPPITNAGDANSVLSALQATNQFSGCGTNNKYVGTTSTLITAGGAANLQVKRLVQPTPNGLPCASVTFSGVSQFSSHNGAAYPQFASSGTQISGFAFISADLFTTDANGKPISQKITRPEDLSWSPNQSISRSVPGNGTYTFNVQQSGKNFTLRAGF